MFEGNVNTVEMAEGGETLKKTFDDDELTVNVLTEIDVSELDFPA